MYIIYITFILLIYFNNLTNLLTIYYLYIIYELRIKKIQSGIFAIIFLRHLEPRTRVKPPLPGGGGGGGGRAVPRLFLLLYPGNSP
jgi:hypothetical protein